MSPIIGCVHFSFICFIFRNGSVDISGQNITICSLNDNPWEEV